MQMTVTLRGRTRFAALLHRLEQAADHRAAIDAAQSTHPDPGGPRARLHRALVASRGVAPSIPVHISTIMSCVSGTDVLW